MILPDRGTATTVPCTLYIQTVVCTVDLWTCNCFEMAPRDFPELETMLGSLDSPILVFLAESSGSIKQALFKFGPEKSSAVIT